MINNDCNEMFSYSNFKDMHSNTIKKNLLFMNLPSSNSRNKDYI
jgi:hypothetical protein